MSKRRKEIGFAIIYFGTIGWFIVSSLLGFAGEYFLYLSIISLMALECVGCFFLASKTGRRYPIAEADTEEIKREDDVLLQSTPFISAIVLFYLNTLVTDTHNKIVLANAIVYLTLIFFVLRGYAKIKPNRFSRFVSAIFLVWLASSFGFVFLLSYFPSIFPSFLKLSLLAFVLFGTSLCIVPFLSSAFAAVYFRQRYGIERVRLSIRKGLITLEDG